MNICIIGLLEVYACAWPADHLIDVVSCISMTFLNQHNSNEKAINMYHILSLNSGLFIAHNC